MKITKEEKTVLITIIIAAVAGLMINFFMSYNNKLQVKNISDAPLLLNLNTASAVELDKLPGVGKTIAGRIVKYRELKNGFKEVEELKTIKGITKAKYELIKKYVIVTTE